MWQDKLKELGVSIHVIATGAGASVQQELWETPGSSAYLSGGSFPYSIEEQASILGFHPKHACSQETVIDLASNAYMKAYQWHGKKAVGLGLTASVASEQEHRGDHRLHVCVMTDDKVLWSYKLLTKSSGLQARRMDNTICESYGLGLLKKALGLRSPDIAFRDVSALARERLFLRPFFTANGLRLTDVPMPEGRFDFGGYALMSGAFNPPHEGHYGIAHRMLMDYGKQAIFEITATPPHKEDLTTQQLLQRAKLLQGRDRVFTYNLPYYLDKARAFPGMPLMMGADAAQRMLDPKWGYNPQHMLEEFKKLNTHFYINARTINGNLITREDIESSLPTFQADLFHWLSHSIRGNWDLSSTDLRAKL